MGKVHKIKWEGKGREAWLSQRKHIQGIGVDKDWVRLGSSDCSTVLNTSSWCVPRKLWYNMMDMYTTEFKNMSTGMGMLSEPMIANAFKYWVPDEEEFLSNLQTDTKVRNITQAKYFLTNDDYPHLMASLDYTMSNRYPCPFTGEKLKKGAVVEIKNVSEWAFKSWEGEINYPYLVQLQEQLMVSGYDKGYLVVCVGGNDIHVFEVLPDPELWKLIDYETTEFAVSVLKGKVIQAEILEQEEQGLMETEYLGQLYSMLHELEPEITDSNKEREWMQDELYAESSDNLTYLGGEKEEKLAEEYLQINALSKELGSQKNLIRNKLIDEMGGHFEVMEVGQYKISNKKGGKFAISKKK